MVNRPSVPEIITVNSEALQTQIRDLLPSPNGFGSELQASNVIMPIIDLTATAEGSGLGTNLQTAIAFGSQTAFSTAGATTVLANSPGFYRIFGTVAQATSAGANTTSTFQMSDGLSTKNVWELSTPAYQAGHINANFDFIVWLAAGESISAISDNALVVMSGSIRQVADSQGQLVQPSGYPL